MSHRLINEVPVKRVSDLINKVKDAGSKKQTTLKATTAWKGGLKCESQLRDHTVYMDEPKGLGGTDTAPNMVEMVLAAYGSCLVVGYSLNAALRGIEIKDLNVEVEGDMDLAGFFGLSEEASAGFSEMRAIVHLDSDASPEDIEALHDHVLKTSPVGSILTKPLNVSTKLML